MKNMIKTALGVSTMALLASCGLRGDLQTPPPNFSDPPSEEAQQPVDTAVQFAGGEIEDDLVFYNSLGGEIPIPAPDVDVVEESMGEVSHG